MAAFDPAQSPEPVLSVKPKGAWIATYRGGEGQRAEARVRIWPVPGTLGLDLVQRWRPQANTVVFYSSAYFAAVDWSGADRAQAGVLVQAIQRAIGVPTRRDEVPR